MLLYTYHLVYPWSKRSKLVLFLQTEGKATSQTEIMDVLRIGKEKLSTDVSILIIILLRQQGLSTTHELNVPDSNWKTN